MGMRSSNRPLRGEDKTAGPRCAGQDIVDRRDVNR